MESFEKLNKEIRKFVNSNNYFAQSPENSFENIYSLSYQENNSESEVYQPNKIEEKIIRKFGINDIIKVNKNNFKKPQNPIIKNNNETIDTTKKNEIIT